MKRIIYLLNTFTSSDLYQIYLLENGSITKHTCNSIDKKLREQPRKRQIYFKFTEC